MIRRVFVKISELIEILGGSVLRNPVRPLEEFLITQHIQERIPADDSLKQVGALRHRGSDQQSAIAGAINRQLGGSRVFTGDQGFGRGDKIVKNSLLFPKHPGAVPILAEFATAADVRVGKNSAALGPNKSEGPVVRRIADIEPAVAGQQN